MYKFLPAGFSLITVPTYVTLVRLALVPCIVASISAHAWITALLLLAVAGITDVIDGQLARWLNQASALGALLDASADKILLFSCYLSLFFVCGTVSTIPLWFVVFTVLSELLFVFCALYVVFVKKIQGVEPSMVGKLTGLAQVLVVGWFLGCCAGNRTVGPLFYGFLFLIALSRLYVFVDYGIRAYYKQSKV